MLITAFVYILIAVVIGIAFLRNFTKQLVDNKDRSRREQPHHLKEAATMEAAQELFPFEKTKQNHVPAKNETDKNRSPLQVVPRIGEKKANSTVQAVNHKAEVKPKSTVQAPNHKAEDKPKSTVQALNHKAEDNPKSAAQAAPPKTVSQVYTATPAPFASIEMPPRQVLSQGFDSAVIMPLSLEIQLDNIEVTENKLQNNVYNTLVQQLEQTSKVLTQIDEQIQLIELMNFINDQFTKLSSITEHSASR